MSAIAQQRQRESSLTGLSSAWTGTRAARAPRARRARVWPRVRDQRAAAPAFLAERCSRRCTILVCGSPFWKALGVAFRAGSTLIIATHGQRNYAEEDPKRITRRPSTDQAPPASGAARRRPAPPPRRAEASAPGLPVDGAVAPRRPAAEVRTIQTLPGVSTTRCTIPTYPAAPASRRSPTPPTRRRRCRPPRRHRRRRVRGGQRVARDPEGRDDAGRRARVGAGHVGRRARRDRAGAPAVAGRRPPGRHRRPAAVGRSAGGGARQRRLRRHRAPLERPPLRQPVHEARLGAGGRVETAPVRRRDGGAPARRPSNDAKPPTPSTPAAVRRGRTTAGSNRRAARASPTTRS